MSSEREYRSLGDAGLQVSAVAMGCWPIAGMTSLDVNETDSLATLQAALEHGVNFFDTAYCYGRDGESERLIARGLGHRRDEIVIATKGGIHYDRQGKRLLDARPETLQRECDESLRRLGTDRVDLLYLHAPDPGTPLTDSAGALRDLMTAGKTRCVGVSNLTREQLEAFHAVCPVAAFQPPYNMLQRQIERDTLPWCRQHGVAVVVYWPLLKGLLAGQLPRDYVFPPRDGRAKYVMFQGEEWQKNQDFVGLPARDRAGHRQDRGPSRHQLDHSPTRHHRHAVRRQAAVPDHRNRRRHGLATGRTIASAYRLPPWPPAANRPSSGRCDRPGQRTKKPGFREEAGLKSLVSAPCVSRRTSLPRASPRTPHRRLAGRRRFPSRRPFPARSSSLPSPAGSLAALSDSGSVNLSVR